MTVPVQKTEPPRAMPTTDGSASSGVPSTIAWRLALAVTGSPLAQPVSTINERARIITAVSDLRATLSPHGFRAVGFAVHVARTQLCCGPHRSVGQARRTAA